VTEMNGTIQIDNHTGEAATTVRLGNNSTAFVDISVRWRIQPAAADELFLDYRDFDNVRDNLVTRELRAVLNEVFADFDPQRDPGRVGVQRSQRSGQQVPGRRARGPHHPAGLLAEQHGGADGVCEVTFGVFRYAWSDFCGTILMCCA
jgi:hypothetical protein